MTGPRNSARGTATYRPPITAGQSYPPLGFGPDGRPQYGYQPPGLADRPAAAQAEPPAPPPEPPRKPTDPTKRTVLAVAGVLVLLVVVVGAVKWFGNDDSETDFSRRADPPASQNIDDPYLDGNEDPNEPRTSRPPSASEAPRSTSPATPGVPGEYAGKQVTYTAWSSGPSTVLYLDEISVQFGRLNGGSWTKSFVAGQNGLRITVIANSGEASCKISVGGQVVSENRLTADSPGRTVSCSG